MAETALVTGASSGIGLALAELHAKKGGDLLLVARSGDTLEEIAGRLCTDHGIRVEVLAADLGTPEGRDATLAAAEAMGIDLFMNNAGFGGTGDHIERDIDDEVAMVELNVVAMMTLAHGIARQMVARGGGRILNVGSTAGMMPGPGMAVYFATKAFVRSYSLALAEELRPKGVTVTVLAPGYVETNFAERARMEGSRMTKSGGATAEDVARVGYEAMMAGKLHVINQRSLSLALNWLVPLLPTRLVTGAMRRMT